MANGRRQTGREETKPRTLYRKGQCWAAQPDQRRRMSGSFCLVLER